MEEPASMKSMETKMMRKMIKRMHAKEAQGILSHLASHRWSSHLHFDLSHQALIPPVHWWWQRDIDPDIVGRNAFQVRRHNCAGQVA